MKKILLAFIAIVLTNINTYGQCTTTNATSCQCKDSTQTDCDLLPDIRLGEPPFYLYNDQFGVIEYAQTGNGVDNGRLKLTVSTPNTGFGPLEIYTTTTFVCGTDTFLGTAPSICPDLVSYPRILINQRIYHKSGNTMTFYDRPAGTMTYHPAHGHMHVDNWGIYTLRVRDSLQSDPLLWPIVGAGTKLAFCVMDYGTCAGYPDHCKDSLGNSLNSNSDFPNYGLGGGGYNCSDVVQGISSGYVDIYWTSLDGMWIDLPQGICNGQYYLVTEVDPNQNFLEENENNNVYAAPFMLTKQVDSLASTPMFINIASSKVELCQGESVTLTAGTAMPNAQFIWSNGPSTKSISVSASGTYTVDVISQCGTVTSMPVTINVNNPPSAPVVTNDTIPVPGSAILSASSPHTISWYDQPSGGTALSSGTSYITPSINVSTTFYAEVTQTLPGASYMTGLPDSTVGIGGYYNGDQSLVFDCYNPFILHTVKVYSPSAQNITVELRNSSNIVLTTVPITVIAGMNVVTLDLPVTPGLNYQLTRASGDLYRNNPGTTSVGFPFDIQNFCSIKTTTAGDEFWYFFYDWNIKLPDNSCISARIPVEAIVLLPNAIADVSVLNSLTVYPNPANSSINISFKANDDNVAIELIDALGKVSLITNAIADNGTINKTIDVSGINRGIYTIHILSAGKNYYHKIVLN